MKQKNQLNNAKAMTFATIAGISTVLGLASCQQDDNDFFRTQSQSELNSDNDIGGNDSIFVNNNFFYYGNMGVSSGDQYVADIDFGVRALAGNYNPVLSVRASGLQTRSATIPFAHQLMNLVPDKASGSEEAGEVTPIMSRIFKDECGSNTMSTLAELNGKIADVTNMIEELSQKAQDEGVAMCYKNRMQKFNNLQYENCTAFTAYMKQVRAGDMENAQKTLDAWKNTTINNTDIVTATYNYISTIPAIRTNEGMCLTDIYDYWVFQTTPWEHMGYEKREQLRLADIVACTSGYLLARAVHEQNYNNSGKEKMELLDAAFKKFKDFYSARYDVPRHDDKRICQIKDAHIVFSETKDGFGHKCHMFFWDLFNHDWIPEGSRFDVKKFMYGELGRTCDQVINSSLSEKEVEAIVKYYQSRNEAIEKYGLKEKKMESLLEVFMEAGFLIDLNSEQYKNHVLPLSDGCYSMSESLWNNNYILSFKRVAVIDNPLSETIKTNWEVGKLWLPNEDFISSITATSKDKIRRIVRQWDSYDIGSRYKEIRYLHLVIEHRFSGTNPYGAGNTSNKN